MGATGGHYRPVALRTQLWIDSVDERMASAAPLDVHQRMWWAAGGNMRRLRHLAIEVGIGFMAAATGDLIYHMLAEIPGCR